MNMKDSEDVDAELDAFDEHQKERREEEVVQQHSYYCTQLLQLNTCYIGLYELHKMLQSNVLCYAAILQAALRVTSRLSVCPFVPCQPLTPTRGQSNLTKSASRGGIPRLGVTPGGRKLYH